MEYTTLKPEAQAELFRNHLMQAEADHLVHTTDAIEKQRLLDAVPSTGEYEETRVQLRTQIDTLTNLASVAEEKADAMKASLDGLGQPYVLPEPVTEEQRTVDVGAKLDRLIERLEEQNVIPIEADPVQDPQDVLPTVVDPRTP